MLTEERVREIVREEHEITYQRLMAVIETLVDVIVEKGVVPLPSMMMAFERAADQAFRLPGNGAAVLALEQIAASLRSSPPVGH